MTEALEIIENLDDEGQKSDCLVLLELMTEVTGEKVRIWRGNMMGFGVYKYRYESGRTGEWFMTGFCPRKKKLVVYIIAGLDNYEQLLEKLGPHSTGVSCLYIKNLDSIDIAVLRELIGSSVQDMLLKYPS